MESQQESKTIENDGGEWDEEAIEATKEAADRIAGPGKKRISRAKKPTPTPPKAPVEPIQSAGKQENFNLQPEIKEPETKKFVKLDINDQLAINKLSNAIQVAQLDLKLAESKLETASIMFDSSFKTLVLKYQIPDGWTFNLETCEFYPKNVSKIK